MSSPISHCLNVKSSLILEYKLGVLTLKGDLVEFLYAFSSEQ